MARPPRARLTQPIDGRLRAGHPWIFADAVRLDPCRPGDVVDVFDVQGEWIARGVAEPDSPIPVRVWTTTAEVAVDEGLLARRFKEARKRRSWPTTNTNGYRLINGEGDRVPGLVVDIYADVAVIRVDGAGAERWLDPLATLLLDHLQVAAIAVRRSERYRGDAPKAQWHTAPPDAPLTFLEHGLRFAVDPIDGQKTGFFLDQRDNRQRIAQVSVGRRVVNLFGYSGAFSVAAAAAGAAQTTTVDLSKPALDDARRNFELNSLPPAAHIFEAADVFDWLEQFGTAAAPFDVFICDPPSFAHRRSDVKRATAAYERLFARVLEVAPDGARVALASCSSHINRTSFTGIVERAAQQSAVSYVLHGLFGAADDHTWLPAFPEGDYLQFSLGTISR